MRLPILDCQNRLGGFLLSSIVTVRFLRHCRAMNIESERGKIGAENDRGIHCPAMPEKTHGRTAQ
ncbi:MAG TPA: hypothetical protein VGN42_26675 [Pirellulales bacterium]|nr:hypothetical protein [Pirellulales bacterium]